MFIQTEETPNPNSLKFIPGVEVSSEKTVNFTSKKDCKESLLAKSLMDIKYVKSLLFGKDFITVTKQKNKEWNIVKPEILLTIMEHFSANLPVFNSAPNSTNTDNNEDCKIDPDDDEATKHIKEIIEHYVRPAVAQDGGDIVFHEFKEGVVRLELRGACSDCPSANVTLKDGIENMLKHYVPEVKSVEAINDDTDMIENFETMSYMNPKF